MGLIKSDDNKHQITLTVFTFSNLHCTVFIFKHERSFKTIDIVIQYKSNTYRLMVDLKLMSIGPNLTAFIQTILEIIFILKCVFLSAFPQLDFTIKMLKKNYFYHFFFTSGFFQIKMF